MPKDIIRITDENGLDREVEVLLTLTLDEKDYVIYTEGKETNLGTIQVFISEIKENNGVYELVSIDDEKTYNEIKMKVVQILKGVA